MQIYTFFTFLQKNVYIIEYVKEKPMKVLLIEDDKRIAAAISMMLKSHNIICEHETHGMMGFDSAKLSQYDVIILDMILPDIQGEEILRRLRACDIQTPIIILSCISDTTQKVKALANGADDYLLKPFDKHELLARINAVVRRFNGYSSSTMKIGRLVIDLQLKTASIDDKDLHLTKKEYNMMELLARRKGAVLNKDAFLDHLYDSDCDEPTRKIVDVFICKLRAKIKQALGGNEINAPDIETVWGRGYKLSLKNGADKQLSGDMHQTQPNKKQISDDTEYVSAQSDDDDDTEYVSAQSDDDDSIDDKKYKKIRS